MSRDVITKVVPQNENASGHGVHHASPRAGEHATEVDGLLHAHGHGASRKRGKKHAAASWNDIVASVAILSVAAALVIASWTMRQHTRGERWDTKTLLLNTSTPSQ